MTKVSVPNMACTVIDRAIQVHTHTHTHRQRERDKQIDRQTDMQTGKQMFVVWSKILWKLQQFIQYKMMFRMNSVNVICMHC